MRLKRIKQAVAMFIGSLVVTSSFPIFASANSSDYEYELDLTCSSTHYFDDEEDTTTYFYAETDYEGESVTLVNADDLTEYTMLDDGKFSVSGDDLHMMEYTQPKLNWIQTVQLMKVRRFYHFMLLQKTVLDLKQSL